MCEVPKQFKKAQKLSSKQGWTWERRTNHVVVRDPRGEFVVTISTTMYDGSLTRALQGKLRRAKCPGL